MASTEERLHILKMIEDGKVNPEEGARLLTALKNGGPAAHDGATVARWVRVRVTEPGFSSPNVNIRIPAGLLKAVARFAGPYLDQRGIEVTEVLDQIRSGDVGPLVEVHNEDGTHVEIVVE